MNEFLGEFTHLVFLATAIAVFVIGFIGCGKIVLGKINIPGLHQAVAAA